MAGLANRMNLGFILSTGNNAKSSHEDSDIPELGVITKMATSSSITKRIFFAKIRRRAPDLLCIKSRSFEVKEVDQDFNLKTIAVRDDLDGFTVSSLVVPEPNDPGLEFTSPIMDQEDNIQQNRLPPQMFVMVLQKATSCVEPERSLIFSFGYYDSGSSLQFAVRRYPLPHFGDNTLGISMAVDPQARFLTVTAQTGFFYVYRLKHWDSVREEVEQQNGIRSDNFNPVSEHKDKQIQLSGTNTIWQMEFVPSHQDNPDSALLLVMTENQYGLVMLVYRIDNGSLNRQRCGTPLQSYLLDKMLTKANLDSRSLLIPLKKLPGVVLYGHKYLAVTADVTKPDFYSTSHPNDAPLDMPDDTGFLRHDPITVAWVRPFRRNAFFNGSKERSHNDLIYLCREDGFIRQLEIKGLNSGVRPETTEHVIGHLRFNPSKAVTMVNSKSIASSHYDAMLIGASQSNGALIVVRPRKFPSLQAVVASSGPVIDCALVPCHGSSGSSRNRLFATTNAGRRHGAISEIRHGNEIRVIRDINHHVIKNEIEDQENESTQRIVVDNEPFNKAVTLTYGDVPYLFVSQADGGIAVYQATRVPMVAQEDSFQQDGHDLCWSRLAADDLGVWQNLLKDQDLTIEIASLGGGKHVRVTASGVQQTFPHQCEMVESIYSCPANIRITAAVVNSFDSRILYVARDSEALYRLFLLSFDTSGILSSTYTELETEPACFLAPIGLHPVSAIASFQDGTLRLYQSNQDCLLAIGEQNLGGFEGACQSIVLLDRGARDGSSGKSLLCALRSGVVKLFDLEWMQDTIRIHERDSIILGTTAARVTPFYAADSKSDGTTSSALLWCDEDLYVFVDANYGFGETTLKRLWYTNSLGEGIRQPETIAVAAIPPWLPRGVMPASDIICITQDRVQSAEHADQSITWIRQCQVNVQQEPRNEPWQILVGGSPTRILWSSRWQVLIVGVELQLTPDTASRSSKTFTYSAIKIIDLDDLNNLPTRLEEYNHFDVLPAIPDRNAYAAFVQAPGERVVGLAEWSISSGDREWHMLIVATHDTTEEPNGKEGRITLFNFGNKTQLNKQHEWMNRSRDPIRAVAVYDSRSCLVLLEYSLVLLQLQKEPGRYALKEIIRGRFTEQFTRHISVQNGLIRVGTKHHGLKILEIRNHAFHTAFSATEGSRIYDSVSIPAHSIQQPGDTSSLSHVNSNNLSIQIQQTPRTGEAECTIACHYQAAQHSEPTDSLPLICSTTLPTQLTTLQQSSLRPPLKENPYYTTYPRILASALDGTFYNIDLLPLPVWRVLRLLQNLIEYDQRLCPFFPSEHAARQGRYWSIIPSVGSKPEERNVNGDVLKRILGGSLPSTVDSSGDSGSSDDDKTVAFVKSLIRQDGVEQEDRVKNLEGEVELAVRDAVGVEGVRTSGGVAEALIDLVRVVVDAP